MSPPKQPEKQLSLHETLPLGTPERSKLRSQITPRTSHGGQPSKGRRKTPRPFTAKAPVHIVLKSKRAKGQWSLLHRRNKSKVLSMIYVYATRFKVHVYRASNVGDHIHLLVRAQEKKQLQDYLRVLAGRIAITVTGARKGIKRLDSHPDFRKEEQKQLKRRKFWDYLCWSRLVAWGRDFYFVSSYVLANELEGIGLEVEAAERANSASEKPANRKTGPPLSKQYREMIRAQSGWWAEVSYV